MKIKILVLKSIYIMVLRFEIMTTNIIFLCFVNTAVHPITLLTVGGQNKKQLLTNAFQSSCLKKKYSFTRQPLS